MKALRTVLLPVLLLAIGLGCQSPQVRLLEDLPDPPLSPRPDRLLAEAPSANSSQSAAAPAEDQSLPPGWIPAGYENPWRYIVLHHSSTDEGSAETFDQLHRSPPRNWDQLGYHFVIGNGTETADGQIEVGPRWLTQKWGAHTGDADRNEYNNYGIGICLVGDFNDQTPTDAQLTSLGRLLAFLMARYDIPAERVLGHRDAPNAQTDCPGDEFYQWIEREFRGND